MLELKVRVAITDNLKYKGGRLKEKNQGPRIDGKSIQVIDHHKMALKADAVYK